MEAWWRGENTGLLRPHKWRNPQRRSESSSLNVRRLVRHLFAGDYACHFSRAALVSGVSYVRTGGRRSYGRPRSWHQDMHRGLTGAQLGSSPNRRCRHNRN